MHSCGYQLATRRVCVIKHHGLKAGLVRSNEHSLVLELSLMVNLRKRSVNCSIVTFSDGKDLRVLAHDNILTMQECKLLFVLHTHKRLIIFIHARAHVENR